ncbi:hypothetical protein [uncultured Neglectibacter sp.]|uniref:hypothetical protein n=1 Tax=uncultured Neglectibacter sp. TaxID=1924108 RepID=UPI0034DF683B
MLCRIISLNDSKRCKRPSFDSPVFAASGFITLPEYHEFPVLSIGRAGFFFFGDDWGRGWLPGILAEGGDALWNLHKPPSSISPDCQWILLFQFFIL